MLVLGSSQVSTIITNKHVRSSVFARCKSQLIRCTFWLLGNTKTTVCGHHKIPFRIAITYLRVF